MKVEIVGKKKITINSVNDQENEAKTEVGRDSKVKEEEQRK